MFVFNSIASRSLVFLVVVVVLATMTPGFSPVVRADSGDGAGADKVMEPTVEEKEPVEEKPVEESVEKKEAGDEPGIDGVIDLYRSKFRGMTFGRWMLTTKDYTSDHYTHRADWLGNLPYEPITHIFLDTAATSSSQAYDNLCAALANRGFAEDSDHSDHYYAYINSSYEHIHGITWDNGDEWGHSVDHGRIFGPVWNSREKAYITVGAFSQERPMIWNPPHAFQSFAHSVNALRTPSGWQQSRWPHGASSEDFDGNVDVFTFAVVGSGSYERDDSFQYAQSTSIGSTYSHQINPARDHDYRYFYANAGQTVTIETFALEGGCDTYMLLYDDTQDLLDYDDDGGSGYASKIVYTIPSSDFYYIQVRDYSSSRGGSSVKYKIKVSTGGGGGDQYEPDNSFSEANNMNWYTNYTHSIDPAGDNDYRKFYGYRYTKYGAVVLETSNLQGGCDTYMYLYDSNYNLLATDDDGGSGLASKIVYNLPSDGYYYVRVREYSSGDGGPDVKYDIRREYQ